MFWKKSKDKDKSKSTTTTIYRTDGGVTSSGSSIISSYESKSKSSANSSSSKTKITISSSQTYSQKQVFSSHITRTLKELEPSTSSSGLSLMDSSKWTNSTSNVNQSKQKAILPPVRQKTEPSIVRRIDATPFNSKYVSPYRNANLPTLRTPTLPGSSVTTVTTTYQSPFTTSRGTRITSSVRENKTSSSSVPFRSSVITTSTPGLFSSSPKTKTSSAATSTIWNPMSSIENAKSTSNQTWNKFNILQPKSTVNPSSTLAISTTSSSSQQPKTSNSSPYTVASVSTSRQPTTFLNKPSTLPPKTTSAAPVNKKKQSPGVVHIFHNDKFDSPDKEFRIGSIEDVRLLKKTFQNFKMQVNLYENLTVKQVEDKVRKIELKDYGNVSCIVVVILTHGTRYETVAAKDGSYSIDDTVLFPILRNRSLRSKPKLLFIQACKGSMEPGKFHKDAIQPNGPPDEILKCYSTFEGYVAYRTEKGSLFIQSLCELLQTHGKSANIKDIMDMVIRNVKTKSGGIQIPSYETTLTEPYVFGEFM